MKFASLLLLLLLGASGHATADRERVMVVFENTISIYDLDGALITSFPIEFEFLMQKNRDYTFELGIDNDSQIRLFLDTQERER